LAPYFRAVRAHRLVFVLVVAACLLGSLLWLAVRSPDYEASARLLVSPLPQEDQEFLGFDLLRESGDPTRTVQTAATLVESQRAAELTARALGDDWTATRVLDVVDVEPEGESNIVAVTAHADSAELAARVANRFVRSALTERNAALERQIDSELRRLRAQRSSQPPTTQEGELTLEERISGLEALQQRGDPTLKLSQAAVPPDSSSSASAPLVVALALVAGLALGTGAAVLLEITGRRLRDEDEAVQIFPLPILARVPELARRFRPEPGGAQGWFMPPSVREAFRTLFVQLERSENARVIMLTSASTGDGKTTSAINLAASIASAGQRVILLDFDLRKPDVGMMVGSATEIPPMTLSNPAIALDELLVEVDGLPNLALLPTDAISGHDLGLVEVFAARVPDLIEQARQLADYVVVDTAPLGEVSDALRFTREVDELIVVVHPGVTNRSNFQVMRDLLRGAGDSPRGLLVIGDTSGGSNRYHAYGVARARKGLFPGQPG
jgi:capsular polysaccharide biosynthesis protein